MIVGFAFSFLVGHILVMSVCIVSCCLKEW